jgi:hypothetical protein
MTRRRRIDGALSETPETHDFVKLGHPEKSRLRVASESETNRPPPARSVLVPLTTRLQSATSNALRRAYLEQKLASKRPDTQQEIVESALQEWLRRQGFLS